MARLRLDPLAVMRRGMASARWWPVVLACVLGGCGGGCEPGAPAVVDAGSVGPVRAGKIELGIVTGQLQGDSVERAVKAAIPGIGGCLAASNRPPFRFSAELRIDGSGTHVENVIWEDGNGPESCIRDGLSAMRLTSRPDATRATYTLRYER